MLGKALRNALVVSAMDCETYLVIHGTSDSENPITSPMAELYSLRMGLYNTVGDLFPGGMKELLVPSFVI